MPLWKVGRRSLHRLKCASQDQHGKRSTSRNIFRVAIDALIAWFVVGAVTLAIRCAVGARAEPLIAPYGLLNDGCPEFDIGRFRGGWGRIIDGHKGLMARATGKREKQKDGKSLSLFMTVVARHRRRPA